MLVLSEFAGAAAQLQSGALLVNPYDIEGVADASIKRFKCRCPNGAHACGACAARSASRRFSGGRIYSCAPRDNGVSVLIVELLDHAAVRAAARQSGAPRRPRSWICNWRLIPKKLSGFGDKYGKYLFF